MLNAEHKAFENSLRVSALLHFAETVVGESVVVIKKLLQMQVWRQFHILQHVLVVNARDETYINRLHLLPLCFLFCIGTGRRVQRWFTWRVSE